MKQKLNVPIKTMSIGFDIYLLRTTKTYILNTFLKKSRENTENIAYIKNHKLLVNGKVYTIEEYEELENDIRRISIESSL